MTKERNKYRVLREKSNNHVDNTVQKKPRVISIGNNLSTKLNEIFGKGSPYDSSSFGEDIKINNEFDDKRSNFISPSKEAIERGNDVVIVKNIGLNYVENPVELFSSKIVRFGKLKMVDEIDVIGREREE